MPTYRLTEPDGSTALLEADSARREGIHTVMRGIVYVMGRPREMVVRGASPSVRVEVVEDVRVGDGHSSATPG